MQIESFRNLHRSAADRAEEARRTGRSDDAATSGRTTGSTDSLDTSVASFIDEAVRKSGRELDTRIEALMPRRDELLALADDPAAIRRAAQAFLRDAPEV